VRHIVRGHLTAMSVDLSEILTTPPLEFRERGNSILGYNDLTPTQGNALYDISLLQLTTGTVSLKFSQDHSLAV